MKCLHCKGSMVRKVAPFHVDRDGYHLQLDAVPAWVCAQCGEVLFAEAEVDAIQQTISSLDKNAQKLLLTA